MIYYCNLLSNVSRLVFIKDFKVYTNATSSAKMVWPALKTQLNVFIWILFYSEIVGVALLKNIQLQQNKAKTWNKVTVSCQLYENSIFFVLDSTNVRH